MVSQPCIVRPADKKDLAILTSFLQTLFSIEEDFEFNNELQQKGIGLMLANDHGCILVAEIAGKVVGMCSGQLTISTAEGGPALLVEDVVVHEDFRGKGVGGKLMDEIARWAGKYGATRLQLLADQNNSGALAFYRKLGWQATQLICLRKRVPG